MKTDALVFQKVPNPGDNEDRPDDIQYLAYHLRFIAVSIVTHPLSVGNNERSNAGSMGGLLFNHYRLSRNVISGKQRPVLRSKVRKGT